MSFRNPKLRILIVDRKWQFHIWRLTAGTSILAGILYLIAGLVLMLCLPIEELSAEEIGFIAFAMNAVFFVVQAVLLLFVTLRFTRPPRGWYPHQRSAGGWGHGEGAQPPSSVGVPNGPSRSGAGSRGSGPRR